ncbi:hypothetical protein [Hahella sp. HN01]|uniref:hypothetical protein n=1 Tax=Hahella sp. HN01 TaxID=2847262 RepID=UPI001C1EC8CE|nr:hypothetical protein [Hahella sp. HN01]MBU6952286.1 hypothetical protein [Hahella sp. HN01]
MSKSFSNDVVDEKAKGVKSSKITDVSEKCPNLASFPGNSIDKVEELVLEMDCGGYPFDEAPFFKMSNPVERWKVRPTDDNGTSTRDPETSDTEKLKKAFEKYVDEANQKGGLPASEIEVVDNMLRPKHGPAFTSNGMTGKEMVTMLNGLNEDEFKSHPPSYKVSYHHLKPTWAGGKNDNNVFPVRPGHQTAGVHRWWNAKLANSPTPQQLAEILGGDEEPKVKQVSENNIGKIAERLSKKSPPKKLMIEMACPEACPI